MGHDLAAFDEAIGEMVDKANEAGLDPENVELILQKHAQQLRRDQEDSAGSDT